MSTSSWLLSNHYPVESWAYQSNFLTPEQCKFIIDYGKTLPLKAGQIGDFDGKENTEYRKSNIAFLPSDDPIVQWVFQKCTSLVHNINSQYFQYDLDAIESLQFTCYDNPGDHYDYHVDSQYMTNAPRKLSFSILLSDPSEFEGGDLELMYDKTPILAKREFGGANFFRSNILHRVTPVTSGERYSLVGWVTGPKFK
jgi:PKHD-type hydroxylase